MNMEQLKCEFSARFETRGSDLVGKGDEYRTPQYKVLSNKDGKLIIRIFTCLAGGSASFASGEVKLSDGSIHLLAGIKYTPDEEGCMVEEFHLEAWELTYTVKHEKEIIFNNVYFQKEQIFEIS